MERNDQARRPGHVVGHTGGGGDSDAVRSGCRFLARPLFAFFGPRGGVTRGPITSPPNQRAEELATRTQSRCEVSLLAQNSDCTRVLPCFSSSPIDLAATLRLSSGST
jgi:hypothetical protein